MIRIVLILIRLFVFLSLLFVSIVSLFICFSFPFPQIFKPWTGWQSRWSRPPVTLWRPRLVQNMTNERRIITEETNEDINAFYTLKQQQQQAQAQQPKQK